jgi:hypothetical protein
MRTRVLLPKGTMTERSGTSASHRRPLPPAGYGITDGQLAALVQECWDRAATLLEPFHSKEEAREAVESALVFAAGRSHRHKEALRLFRAYKDRFTIPAKHRVTRQQRAFWLMASRLFNLSVPGDDGNLVFPFLFPSTRGNADSDPRNLQKAADAIGVGLRNLPPASPRDEQAGPPRYVSAYAVRKDIERYIQRSEIDYQKKLQRVKAARTSRKTV